MRNLFLISFIFFSLKIHSQHGADKEFLEIRNIVATENNLKNIEQKLKQYKSTFKDQFKSSVNVFLQRDIDFGYIHTRIQASLEMNNYQIDFITKNDSIYLKSIKNEYYKNCCSYQWLNEDQLNFYVLKRNKFYASNKKLETIISEISSNLEYAMYCGEVYSLTPQGAQVSKFVLKKDFKGLTEMLSSFSCEMQAFGVAGFSLLSKEKIAIPDQCSKLVTYLKNRNSELQICSGCISGLVEKVY